MFITTVLNSVCEGGDASYTTNFSVMIYVNAYTKILIKSALLNILSFRYVMLHLEGIAVHFLHFTDGNIS